MKGEAIKILLVEDNPDHVMLIKTVLGENNLLIVTDGQEALDYIYHKGKYADENKAPRPDLIFLDLKLPKVDGFEVLSQLKSDPELKSIPIIILTTSSQNEEIVRGYARGANSYITKPVKFNEFVDKIKNLKLYWAFVNTLPKE